jgi:hypothetical protein
MARAIDYWTPWSKHDNRGSDCVGEVFVNLASLVNLGDLVVGTVGAGSGT